MDSRKAILFIMDGLGDRPIPALGEKTPLQGAMTPTLDSIARRGSCGIMDVAPVPGRVLGSDVSHLILLGRDIETEYPGRGPLEALGVGFSLSPGDVALRGNFAHVDEGGIIVDRRAGRHILEGKEFARLLTGMRLESFPGIQVEFKHSTEQRVACVIRGEGLSSKVSATNPDTQGVPVKKCEPTSDDPAAAKTARIINEITAAAQKTLRGCDLNEARIGRGLPPVTGVLFHGAGQALKIPSMKESSDVSAACIAGNGLIKGVCCYLGMDCIPVKGATGRLDTNLENKMDAVIGALKKYDLVFLHVKATDSTGHDKKPLLKLDFLEHIDAALGKIIDKIDWLTTTIFITGDHATPCSLGAHSGDPVPVVMAGADTIADDVTSFDEESCSHGYLKRINGSYFFNLMLNRLRKLKKYGA